MNIRNESFLFVGLLTGSLWAFSEVVFGASLRAAATPLRGMLLTGVGVAMLFAGFGYSRQIRVAGVALITTVIAKISFAPVVNLKIRVVNGSVAVLCTGLFVLLSMYLLQSHRFLKMKTIGLLAFSAVLGGGTIFYAVGIHLNPCAYLNQFTPLSFLLRETLLWSLLSSITAPLGFLGGTRLAARYPLPDETFKLTFPAWGLVTGCWLCCGLAVLFMF